jgi:hypothetical protein
MIFRTLKNGLLTLAAALALSGCAVPGGPAGPPPPRAEERPLPLISAEEQIWRPGHWNWDGNSYVWIPGQYEPRGNHSIMWQPGFWDRDQTGWFWRPPHWL